MEKESRIIENKMGPGGSEQRKRELYLHEPTKTQITQLLIIASIAFYTQSHSTAFAKKTAQNL